MSKLTDPAIALGVPSESDFIHFVDRDDTTHGADGTSKKALFSNFKGPQGDPGDAGAPGVDGDDGSDGDDGDDGTDGDDGAPGVDGSDGVDGTSGIQSNITGIAGASQIVNAVQLSQAAYDALVSPNSQTLYVIS